VREHVRRFVPMVRPGCLSLGPRIARHLEGLRPGRMIREGVPDDVGTRVLAAARAFASVG
jgi:hypothetical protein